MSQTEDARADDRTRLSTTRHAYVRAIAAALLLLFAYSVGAPKSARAQCLAIGVDPNYIQCGSLYGSYSAGSSVDLQVDIDASGVGQTTPTTLTVIDLNDNSGARNFGTITVDEDNAFGIDAGNLLSSREFDDPGSGIYQRVVNQGTLDVSGDNSVGIRVGDGWSMDFHSASPGRVIAAGPDSDITVSGTGSVGWVTGARGDLSIQGTTTISGADSTGFRMGANSRLFITELNLGDGVFDTTILVTGANAHAVEITAPTDPALAADVDFRDFEMIDETRITGGPSAGALIVVNGLPAAGGYTVFSINGEVLAAPGRVAIQGGAGADFVQNDELIEGDILLGDGDDIYQHFSNSIYRNGVIDGGNGVDDLRFLGPTSQIFDLDLIRNFETMTWESTAFQTLNGSATFQRGTIGSGAFFNLEGDAGTTLTFTDPAGLVFDPGAGLRVGYAGGSFSPIKINGYVKLDGTLQFSTPLPTSSFDTPIRLAVIDATGIDPTSGFGTIQAINLSVLPLFCAAGLDIVVSSQPLGSVPLCTPSTTIAGTNPNQQAIASHLAAIDAIGTAPGTEVDSLIGDLLLRPQSSVDELLSQLIPESYDAQSSATLSLGHRFNQLLLERPRTCIASRGERRRDPRTKLPCRERRFEPWLSAYGQLSDRDPRSYNLGAELQGMGMAFGIDHRPLPGVLLAAAVGSSHGVIRVAGAGKGRQTTIDLATHASYQRRSARVQGIFSYGYGVHDSFRKIRADSFGRTARGEYASHRIGLRVQGDYALEAGVFDFVPGVSLDYTQLVREAFSETGAGNVGLAVESASDAIVTARVGVDVAASFQKDEYWTDLLEYADGVWRPRISARWRQVVAGADRTITARMQAAPTAVGSFDVEADDADMGFELGAGFDFTPKGANRLTFSLRYDAFVWDGVLSHDFGGRFRLSF